MQASAVAFVMRQAWSVARMGKAGASVRRARMAGSPMVSAYSTGSGIVEMCFIDPKLALGPREGGAASVQQLVSQGHALVVPVPAAFAPHLTEGVHELGEDDDPLNAWCWGEKGEIFQYTMAGTHSTQSGFTAVIPKSDLEALLQGAQGQQLLQQQPPSWQNFLRALNDSGEGGREDGGTGDGAIRPFLFAGRILESDLASVYLLKSGCDVTGVLVSSAAAGSD